MNLTLALDRSVRRCPLATFQNPNPPIKPQPSIAVFSPPKCFDRLLSSSSLRNGARSHDTCRIRTRVRVRSGGSARGAQSFASSSVPNGGDKEELLREPSFLEFITSERVKVVAMIALALALCNADRVVMSVAIVPLSLANGWRQSFAGVVQH
ncbi:hypothetical protein U1Q18_033442 [Sarracenia purpurea var. burkii]